MIDISFVQDNLPTPEEQLKLFKEILDLARIQRDVTYSFNFVSQVNRSERHVLKIGCLCVLENIYLYEKDKTYLSKKIESIFFEAAYFIVKQCKERNTNTVYIVEPEALLERTYIEVTQTADSIDLRCLVGIYFE